MTTVKLTGSALYYEHRRYVKGDTLNVSEAFAAKHPTRLQPVEQAEPSKPKRRKRKAAEPAPKPMPPLDEPTPEASSDDGNSSGDNIGL